MFFENVSFRESYVSKSLISKNLGLDIFLLLSERLLGKFTFRQ